MPDWEESVRLLEVVLGVRLEAEPILYGLGTRIGYLATSPSRGTRGSKTRFPARGLSEPNSDYWEFD